MRRLVAAALLIFTVTACLPNEPGCPPNENTAGLNELPVCAP